MKINYAFSKSSVQENLKELWMKNEPAEFDLQIQDGNSIKRLKAVRLDDIVENQVGSLFGVKNVKDNGTSEQAIISGSEAFSAWFALREDDFVENLPEIIEIEIDGKIEKLRLNVSNFKYSVREFEEDDFSKPKKTYNLTEVLVMCLMKELQK